MKEDGWEKIEKKGWGGGWDREETPGREPCRRDSGRRDGDDRMKRS